MMSQCPLYVFNVDVELEMCDDSKVSGSFYTATPFPKEARLSRFIPEVALKAVKAGKQ